MQKTAAMRILITLPPGLKQFLNDLRRLENRTASGYIQHLLREDREARWGSGWRPKDGWKHRESPAYQKYLWECGLRAEKGVNKLILKAAKRIEKEQVARKKRVVKSVVK